jgi:putative tricarboxylic transport membrane protein
MEQILLLLQGFYICVTPANLLACVIGVLVGTLVGVLPGIGPVGAIALLLPFSINMDVTASLIMFAGIYYGSMYGGSTTSILLNVPGEASSIVTCLDGYEMAKKGRAGAALAVAAIGSFIAGTVGIVGLSFFAPLLANFALKFGPAEYFALAFLGLVVLTKMTGQSMLKGCLMVTLGLILGTVGTDSLSGISRFTFGVDELQRGFDLSIVAMGLFGIGEILDTMLQPSDDLKLQAVRLRDLYPNKQECRRAAMPIIRGSFLGFFMGLMPGPASVLSTFVSYAAEKRLSKHPDEFGHGAVEGVAGPEAANNAASSAAMIPLLSLGLPFSAVSAMLLSGFMTHGVIPGPNLITGHPDIFWGLIASMYLGNTLLLIINLPLVGMFATILKTPMKILMPIIIMITMVGVYSINNSIFDIMLVMIFGVLGFYMKRTDYKPAPLIVGLVLGPTLERGLTQGLIIANGDIWSFFMRPIAGTILVVALVLISYNVVNWLIAIKNKPIMRKGGINK